MGSQGPEGKIPFSTGIKITLGFLAAVSVVSLVYEFFSLRNEDTIAPISWAFWWLGENTGPWFPIAMAGTSGAFMSHFFWYRRKGDFWWPTKRWHAVVVAITSLVPLVIIQSWVLLGFGLAFEGSAVLAHRFWYRLEHFNEHLERFH